LLGWIIISLGAKTVWRIGKVKRSVGFIDQIVWTVEPLTLIAVGQKRNGRFRVDSLQPPDIPLRVTRNG